MLPETQPDFLALQPLLVARLTERFVEADPPRVAFVGTAQELLAQRINERTLASPSMFVVYLGYRRPDSKGEAVNVRLFYAVVVAIRNARGQENAEGPQLDASPLLTAVVQALQGWSPPGKQHKALELEDPPEPAQYTPAFGYFPLQFSTVISLFNPEE